MMHKRNWPRMMGMLFLSLLTVVLGRAETCAVNQPYDQLPGTVITPHIAWANPYSLGKTRVLVIAPTWTQRETVELSQRLSLDYLPVMAFSSQSLLGEKEKHSSIEVPADTVKRMVLERLTNNYDAIIIGRMKWDGFPTEIKLAILEKVKTQGCGLLYVAPLEESKELAMVLNKEKAEDTEAFITTGIPVSFLPLLKDIPREGLVSLGQFGKGRVCIINFKQDAEPISPHHSLTPTGLYNDTVQYDYYHSLLAKALLWTANKTPDVFIKEIKSSEAVIKQEAQGNSAIHLSVLSKRPTATSFDVEVVIRDTKTGRMEDEKKESVSIKPGTNEISFKMPKLKDGKHLADVWIREKSNVVNWGSAGFEVRGTGARIEKIVLDKSFYKNGETATGRVVMNQAPDQNMKLRLKLVDSFGREMFKQDLKVKNDREIPFFFKVENALALLLTIETELCAEDGTIAQEIRKEFPCPVRSLDDFPFVMWAGGALPGTTDYVAQLFMRELPKYGVDTIIGKVKGYIMTFPEQLELEMGNVSRANLQFFPIMCHFGPFEYDEGDGGPIRGRKSGKYCLTNPGYRKEVKDDLVKKTEIIGPYGPLAYSLGDENELATKGKDACFSSTCQEDFRIWLKKEYGALDALNKEWGTNYTEWSQAKPITLAQAKENGQFARWADHREHMDEIFANMFGYCQDVTRQIDPGARTGSEGFMGLTGYSGLDWTRLLKVMNLCGLYCSLDNPGIYPNKEIVRSLAGKDCLTGMYFSSGYMGDFGRFLSYCNPVYSKYYMESFPWYSLFNGMNSALWYGGIPSQGLGGESIFTPDFTPLPGFATASREVMEIKAGIGKLLLESQREDDGIAVLYSPASVRASEFSCKETTIQESMSDFISLLEDAALQYRFCSSGEIEQGKLSEGNYKVLLLPFSQALSSREAERIEAFVKNGGVVIADYSPGIMDEHCRKRDRAALEQMMNTNACPTVTKLGKGKGIYAGKVFTKYLKHRENGEDARSIMLRMLKTAGVEPRVKITKASGEVFWPVEISIFKNSGVEYAAFQRDYTVGDLKPVEVAIQLPYPAYVHAVRENKAFGFTDKISMSLLPGRGGILALLPYEVEQVEVGIKNTDCRQGESLAYNVKIAVSKGKCADHVVRLEVKGPEGKILPWYSRNLTVRDGKYNGNIPLSLNEKEGEYRLMLRDVASGKNAEQKFKVKRGKHHNE